MKILALAGGAALAVAWACTLPAGDFSGRTCAAQRDCPEPYACVAIQPGALRTCELLASPSHSDAGPVTYDGGGVFYCSQAKPLLDTYCSGCHGPQQRYGGNFRLDWYSADAGTPGAKEKASRIMDRAVLSNSMPPPSTPTGAPTEEERHALGVWITAGTPFCGPDGGTPDSGS